MVLQSIVVNVRIKGKMRIYIFNSTL